MTNTGMLVQNNTLEYLGKGVAQAGANMVNEMLGPNAAKETLLFWLIVFIAIIGIIWALKRH